jgi:hypothetical protein
MATANLLFCICHFLAFIVQKRFTGRIAFLFCVLKSLPALFFESGGSMAVSPNERIKKVLRTTFSAEAMVRKNREAREADRLRSLWSTSQFNAGLGRKTLQDLNRAVMMDEGVPEIYELRRQDTFMPRL